VVITGHTLLLFLFCVGFVIRSLDVLRFEGYRSDTFYNLLIAKLIKKNHYRYPKKNPYFVVKSGKIALPPFLPYLLSVFQDKISVRTLHLLPKFTDLITAMIVYYVGNSLFTEEVALFAAAFYLATIDTVVECQGISARPFGNLFLTITLITLFYGMSNPVYLALSVVFASLTMLTHRMATQVMFFAALSLALPFLSLEVSYLLYPLATLLGGFILAMILSKGQYFFFLREHLWLIRFFYRWRVVERKEKHFVNPFFIFVLNFWMVFPVLLAGLWLLSTLQRFDIIISVIEPISIPRSIQSFLLWSLTTMVMALIWFWGKGEHHILFSGASTALVASWFIQEFFKGDFVILVSAFGITFEMLTVLVGLLISKPSLAITEPFKECLTFLKDLSTDTVVVCWPFSYNRAVAFYTEKKVVSSDASSVARMNFRGVPDIKNHEALKEFVKKYGVNYALVNSQEVDTSSLPPNWGLVMTRGNWQIYRLTGTEENK